MLVELTKWLNDNQGLLSLLIFFSTILIAWVSGLFSALRRKPKLLISLLDGPTFCATFPTGKKHEDFDVHRTGVALYLKISNVGSAATSIDNVMLGYRWHVRPFSAVWLRHRIFWFWLYNPAIVIRDFQVAIGENVKFYPSLFQRSSVSGRSTDTYLQIGQSINGVVYFEQPEAWGGCFPSPKDGRTKIKIAVADAFGRRHQRVFWIPCVSLEEAKKYNPSFGDTFSTVRGTLTTDETKRSSI